MKDVLILKGNIVEAPGLGRLSCTEGGYLIAEGGVIVGVFPELPDKYSGAHITDCGSKIITQSFCDMHLHAPQYPNLGLGLDMQLMDWLQEYTYPTEARFADSEYANHVYTAFAKELADAGTTRVAAFSSIHNEATDILAKKLEERNITGFIGKVNMDRNCYEPLKEDTKESLRATEEWLERAKDYRLLKPMVTPRYVPACSDELLAGLGDIAYRYDVPVQSHLSENIQEMVWVKELCPDSVGYWHVYERNGLMRPGSLMAHCVYSDHNERRILRDKGVYAVHCPCSNMDLASGIMPLRRFIYEGIGVLLGSDIAGGAAIFMPRIIEATVRISKLNWVATAESERILSVEEAFYLATSAGAIRMGCHAGFAAGDPLHCIVVDDSRMCAADRERSLKDRFERMIHRMQPADITAVWSEGVKIK